MHCGLSRKVHWQALDEAENVMAPKVLEALLGTRFQGRDFLKSPLVRSHFQTNILCTLHSTFSQSLRHFLTRALVTLQICGSRCTVAIDADGQVGNLHLPPASDPSPTLYHTSN